MKKSIVLAIIYLIIFVVGSVAPIGITPIAQAMTPTLSLYATGNNSVQVTVNGDSNSSVTLYYPQTSYNYGNQSQYLGSTNYNGYFSTTISTNQYNINPGNLIYVTVNNQQSQSTPWPYFSNYYSGYGGSNIYLSQTSVGLSVNQSAYITITGGNAPYTMFSNSSNIFQGVISGNSLWITGLSYGSATMSVCSSGAYSGSSGCATLIINVNYNNNYYNNNCNNNYYNNNCGNYYNNQTPTPISFSQSNPNISINQSVSLSIYGGSGSGYYISHNSNTSAVSAYISGSTLNITANQNSVTVIVVCSSSNSCGAVTVTVGYNNYNYNNNYYNPGGNWTYCANENQYCNFSGARNIRYGANGNYYYRTFTNNVLCANSTFGDPAYLTVKQCSYQN